MPCYGSNLDPCVGIELRSREEGVSRYVCPFIGGDSCKSVDGEKFYNFN
jgi:hypothetical protein